MSRSSPFKPLAAIALATAVPIIIFATLVGVLVIDARRTEVERRYQAMATALMSAVDVSLKEQIISMQILSSAPVLHSGDFERFHDYISAVIRQHHLWRMVILQSIDGDLTLLTSATPYGVDLPSPPRPEEIRQVAESRQPLIGPLSPRGNLVEEPYFPVRVPVIIDGVVSFVLSAAISPSNIAALMQTQEVPENYLLTVYDAGGHVIARSQGSDDGVGVLASPEVRAAMHAGDGRLFRGTSDGREYHRVLMTSTATGWHVSVGQTSAAYSSMIIWTALSVGLGGLLAAGLSAFMAVILGRRFGRRLSQRERARSEEIEHARREAVAAREAALSAAVKAEKAGQARMRFLAAASHDLRQPMQSLRLLVEVLHLQTMPDKGRAAVAMMDRALSATEALLRALLDVSKLEAGLVAVRTTDFPIATLLDALEATYRPIANEKGLRLRVRRCPTLVSSDPALLGEILHNLVGNAIKFTEHGGVLVGCRRIGGTLRIEIWDTGKGIPAEQLELIWEEFYQIGNDARDKSHGLGLGLAIVQRTAQLLGCCVEARSRLGHGSVFSLQVQLASTGMNLAQRPASATA